MPGSFWTPSDTYGALDRNAVQLRSPTRPGDPSRERPFRLQHPVEAGETRLADTGTFVSLAGGEASAILGGDGQHRALGGAPAAPLQGSLGIALLPIVSTDRGRGQPRARRPDPDRSQAAELVGLAAGEHRGLLLCGGRMARGGGLVEGLLEPGDDPPGHSLAKDCGHLLRVARGCAPACGGADPAQDFARPNG